MGYYLEITICWTWQVQRFAEDNDYWLSKFGTAFSIMLNSGNFGKLKDVVWDTFNDTFEGDIFFPRSKLYIRGGYTAGFILLYYNFYLYTNWNVCFPRFCTSIIIASLPGEFLLFRRSFTIVIKGRKGLVEFNQLFSSIHVHSRKCYIYERWVITAANGLQVGHFQLFGGLLAFDKNQHFAVFSCCAVSGWDYNRIPIIGI